MPRLKTNPVPAYKHHKARNLAVIRIPLGGGARKDIYLGKYGSPESIAEYQRIIAELAVQPVIPEVASKQPDITVSEVINAFGIHADKHYRRADGTHTHEIIEYRHTLDVVIDLYGHTPAAQFGPLALKAVRQRMIDKRLCRTVINARVGKIKRVFKWAVSQELIPPAVFQGIVTVTGLQRGRSEARESKPVTSVAEEHVAATLPFLRPPVRAMVELQQVTGMRPGEAVTIRPMDIDRSGPVWVYRPPAHKLAYTGKPRAIPLGPKAQAILEPFTPPNEDQTFFSPKRDAVAILKERAEQRLTPLYPSHARNNLVRRRVDPQRRPSAAYTTATYARAVARGIISANVARKRAAKTAGQGEEAVRLIPHWFPHQLRHSHATQVRKLYGLEAAQAVLGHARADVTQIYAERNLDLAAKVALEVG